MRHRAGAAWAVVLVSLLGAALGPVAPAHAIAHGDDAPDGRYAFAVKLTMDDIRDAGGGTRDSACSGSLLTPEWVITAGHCFKDTRGRHVSRPVAKRTTATVGRTDLRSRAGHVSTVVAVRQSPTTDIALARIDPPVRGITPIRLRRTAPKSGTVVRLVGYGRTGDGEPLATRLQTGRFTVSSVRRSFVGMSGHAPEPDTSPCAHDSGGPYFTQRAGVAELVAVVSNGPGCPHTGADDSARVDTIADWIAGVVGRRNLDPPAKPKPSVPVSASPSRPAAPTGPAVAAPRPAPAVPAALTWTAVSGLAVAGCGVLLAGRRRRRARRRAYAVRGIRRHARRRGRDHRA